MGSKYAGRPLLFQTPIVKPIVKLWDSIRFRKAISYGMTGLG